MSSSLTSTSAHHHTIFTEGRNLPVTATVHNYTLWKPGSGALVSVMIIEGGTQGIPVLYYVVQLHHLQLVSSVVWFLEFLP